MYHHRYSEEKKNSLLPLSIYLLRRPNLLPAAIVMRKWDVQDEQHECDSLSIQSAFISTQTGKKKKTHTLIQSFLMFVVCWALKLLDYTLHCTPAPPAPTFVFSVSCLNDERDDRTTTISLLSPPCFIARAPPTHTFNLSSALSHMF